MRKYEGEVEALINDEKVIRTFTVWAKNENQAESLIANKAIDWVIHHPASQEPFIMRKLTSTNEYDLSSITPFTVIFGVICSVAWGMFTHAFFGWNQRLYTFLFLGGYFCNIPLIYLWRKYKYWRANKLS